MSWDDAHRYNEALRAVKAELNWIPDVERVWRAEYRDIFGTPERLVLALRSRWHTTLQAQVEDVVTEYGGPSGTVRALAAAEHGLVRALVRAGAIAELGIAQLDSAPSIAGAA